MTATSRTDLRANASPHESNPNRAMEISGAVVQRSPAVSGVRALRDSGSMPPSGPSAAGFGRRARVSGRPAGVAGGGGRGVFSDVGHLKYYASPVRCGGGRSEKGEKRRAKLVKGLSRGLADLCAVGIGADAGDGDGIAGDVKGKMIAEAAELWLVELTRLRTQEKDSKRMRKEAKAARKKDESSSSSSSSESSDGECDEVVRMRNLRAQAVREPNSVNPPIPVAAPESETGTVEHHIAPKPAQECSSTSNGSGLSLGCSVEKPTKNKIEVCMGGKCRRSGGPELMQELSRKIGVEGAVVECKCMGKCRDGPNVRVLNQSIGNASVPRNPLCLGVRIDDVGAIVANFLGEKDSKLPYGSLQLI
ncbi:hypothetical protein MUK42_12059 [Musa troglodytarum]|uniref:Uncharacterized protein n=1 Tax=Musa troglodytarum TaxID=320322 RepID=A0A9E7GQW4_9LILI|nr:hypothetical protein MUK42_12059 [Musa troglodytarum]